MGIKFSLYLTLYVPHETGSDTPVSAAAVIQRIRVFLICIGFRVSVGVDLCEVRTCAAPPKISL